MRATRRRTIGLALVAFLLLAPVAAAKPGSQIGVHPHVTSRDFDEPFHRIRGRVGIVNNSDRTAQLRCIVVVLLKGSGDTHKRGHDEFGVRVDAGDKRKPHFSVKIRDQRRRFENVPTNVAAHCHQH